MTRCCGPIATAVVLGATCFPALAQEPASMENLFESDEIEQWKLEDLLDGTVMAASKLEESVKEAPSSVTLFTQADIIRLGIRTVERLLNFVPGFQGTTDNGNGLFRFSTRGRNTTPHEYVLVLVDGQRLNDAYSGGAIDTIAVENIKQIEVIRGPGSALYGANAFLGVINITTNREDNSLVAGVGNLHSRYVALNLARRLGDLQTTAFARLYTDDGFKHQDVVDVAGRSGVASDPTQALDVHLTFERKGLALNVQHRERRFSGMSCCTPYSQYSDRTERARSSAQMSYQLELRDGLDLRAAASIARDRSLTLSAEFPRGTIPDVKSGVTLAETYIFGSRWTGNTVAGDLDLRWQLPPLSQLNAKLTAGANYEYVAATEVDDVSSHDTIWQYQGDLYDFAQPPVNRTAVAGFVQGKLDLFSRLQLTGGARLDWYSDFGTSFSPRAALVYLTPFQASLKIMYGQAFRAPSFSELYDRSLRLPFSGPTALHPETVHTFELAYLQQVRDYASASVTYFHNDLGNIIQPPENRLPYRNLGNSRTSGLELELRTRSLAGFSLLGGYTQLILSDEEKENLLVPLHFGAVALTYGWRRLTMNLNTIMRGESKVGGYVLTSVSSSRFLTHQQPAHLLLNLHVQVQVAAAVSLSAVLENALDHRYDRSDDPSPSPGLLTRGRTFMGTVKLNF